MTAMFFAAVFGVFYAYLGYPLSLVALTTWRTRPVKKQEILPSVTLIITVYNEEKRIAQKIENTLKLDYPRPQLQVIVVSDGSTDRTVEILRKFDRHGVEVLALMERRGKEGAQKAAVERAQGDVLVFTDAATVLDERSIREIVGNFADPSVGCVSGEDRLIGGDGRPVGEGAYLRYEMWLRRLESRAQSLVGLSGSFFAARKEFCQDFSITMQSDFRTVLNCVKNGFRGVSDSQAIGYYQSIADDRQEFDRKVRTVLRGLTVFFNHLEFLKVWRYGLFSYQYGCHKLLRWLVPAFLVVAFASNLLIVPTSMVYVVLLIGQIAFYGLGVLGWRRPHLFSGSWVKIPTYFIVVNGAIAVAWWKYLGGQRITRWTPSER